MELSVLEKAGFTKGEIKIYLSLLKLGQSTTGPIIEKSNISGSKVYEILDKLIKKGLVSHIIKEKTKYFQAAHPKRLLDYINKKEQELKKEKTEIEKLIPQLETYSKIVEKSQSAQIYEGYEGIKSVFKLILESLKPKEEYYVFTLGEELRNKNVILFLKNHHAKRIQKKIKVKIIAHTFEKQLSKPLIKLKDLKIKYYPFPVPIGIIIFKDYVATIRFKEPATAFLIKSETIAKSYKDFFEHLWKISKN